MKPAACFTSVAAALSAVFVLALPLSSGCSNNMDPKECDRIRGEAFELLNKAQHCDTDADCMQSDWPGCAKPLSKAGKEQIKPMKESYQKGKCEEPKLECKEPPAVFCKQGLCVHREKGTPEGSGNTPTDQIIIK
jgi:hypothetical protein